MIALRQQAKKGITALGGVINPDYQGGIGLPLHHGGKEDYVNSTEDPLGCYHVLWLKPMENYNSLYQEG